jgi:hypothetical protein
MTPITDAFPARFYDCWILLGAGRRAMDPQIIWKEITTAFEGRAIGGAWAVENGIVRVTFVINCAAMQVEHACGFV